MFESVDFVRVVPVLQPIAAYRVVADPSALLALFEASADSVAPAPRWRIAPDELLRVASHGPHMVELMSAAVRRVDELAIVVAEDGLVGAWFTWVEFDAVVAPRIEWSLPAARPSAALGLVAAVPCQLWLTDELALLTTYATYAYELTQRLS